MARTPTQTPSKPRRPRAVKVAPGVAAPEAAPVAALAVKKPIWTHLYFQVLVAIGLGALIGHFFPTFGESLKPLGDAFIKLVKMIIAPVIFLTVATGIAHLRDLGRLGKVVGKAFAYFL
ncbi:MAG: cation:dicarboxylase symporter family transporter, partial [Pseudomonadota bacterium]